MKKNSADQLWTVAIATFFVIAVVFRLWDIDVRSLSHPEIYIPGLDLVEGISEPPPRFDWLSTIWWHFHDEPHAMGYYLGMKVWTDLFGTSEFALRLPGAIMGALSVVLAALLSARVFGRQTGTVVALLFAMHGFHILWSQTARMYVPAAFVGLISTYCLVRLSQMKTASVRWEVGYILSAFIGTSTSEFYWPFLFLHVAWVVLVLSTNPSWHGQKMSLQKLWNGTRLAQVQSLALMVSAPTLLHAAYRGRTNAAPQPNLNFLQEYFSFGFVLERDPHVIPVLEPATSVAIVALLVCMVLLLSSFAAKSVLPRPMMAIENPQTHPIPNWVRIVGALVVAAFMVWLASIAHRRNEELAAMALLPIMTLALPGVMLGAARLLRNLTWLRSMDPYQLLFVLLAIVPPVLISALSFVVSLLAPRAFTILIPYLLTLCAAGLLALPGGRIARLTVFLLVLFVFILGVLHSYQRPGAPNDYKGLAQKMSLELEVDDLVFVKPRHWVYTPLFYYLPDANYVTEDFGKVIEQNPGRRVWIVLFSGLSPITDQSVMERLNKLGEVDALRSAAQLFEIKRVEE